MHTLSWGGGAQTEKIRILFPGSEVPQQRHRNSRQRSIQQPCIPTQTGSLFEPDLNNSRTLYQGNRG